MHPTSTLLGKFCSAHRARGSTEEVEMFSVQNHLTTDDVNEPLFSSWLSLQDDGTPSCSCAQSRPRSIKTRRSIGKNRETSHLLLIGSKWKSQKHFVHLIQFTLLHPIDRRSNKKHVFAGGCNCKQFEQNPDDRDDDDDDDDDDEEGF